MIAIFVVRLFGDAVARCVSPRCVSHADVVFKIVMLSLQMFLFQGTVPWWWRFFWDFLWWFWNFAICYAWPPFLFEKVRVLRIFCEMMTSIVFMAMTVRMKNNLATTLLLMMMMSALMMVTFVVMMTMESWLCMIVLIVMMMSMMIIVMIRCVSLRCDLFSYIFSKMFFFIVIVKDMCFHVCMCWKCLCCVQMSCEGDAWAFMHICENNDALNCSACMERVFWLLCYFILLSCMSVRILQRLTSPYPLLHRL